jgi:hypothetical protein
MLMKPTGSGALFSLLVTAGRGVVVLRGPIGHALARGAAGVPEDLHP